MYVERYEVTSEGHIQNAFQVPDPFPKGKPDFRKKHEEEQRQKEEQRREAEERRRKKEDEERKQREEQEAKDRREQEEKEAKQLKEAEAKKAKEKAEQEKLLAAQKKAQEEEEKKKAEAKELENGPTDEVAMAALLGQVEAEPSPEQAALPLAQRTRGRKEQYLTWMRDFKKLSPRDKKKVSGKLQNRFLSMEHKELKTFKEKITYTDDEKVEGKVQPSGKKVIILTATDGNGNTEIENVLQMAQENRAEYTAYHGYINYFVNLTKYAEPGRHPVWNKLRAIKEAFDTNPQAEWIWWMDTDMIIMNPELDVAEHILSQRALTERITYGRPLRNPESNFYNGIYMKKGEVDIKKIDLVLSQDFFGLNAGSFFIRRSRFTEILLDLWDDPLYIKANFIRLEQDALIHMFLNHANVQEHVGLVPQRLLNSYADKPEWVWSFVEGDLAVHFAGCNTRGKCNELWTSYWAKRKRVPEAFRLTAQGDATAIVKSEQIIAVENGATGGAVSAGAGQPGVVVAGTEQPAGVVAGSEQSAAVVSGTAQAPGAAAVAAVLGEKPVVEAAVPVKNTQASNAGTVPAGTVPVGGDIAGSVPVGSAPAGGAPGGGAPAGGVPGGVPGGADAAEAPAPAVVAVPDGSVSNTQV